MVFAPLPVSCVSSFEVSLLLSLSVCYEKDVTEYDTSSYEAGPRGFVKMYIDLYPTNSDSSSIT